MHVYENRLFSTMLYCLFLISSERAFSCTACGFGFDETRNAFLWTTLIMSAVPLLSIGALIYFLVKRYRADKFKEI